MTNKATNQPLHVSVNINAPPHLWLPMSQVERVQQLLDAHGVRYWLDDLAISWNGEPETTVINFSHGTDAEAVQRMLDAAADRPER